MWRVLDTLAGKSSKAQPLEVMSFARFQPTAENHMHGNFHGRVGSRRPTTVVSHALDITAFAGHTVNLRAGADWVTRQDATRKMVDALVRALPAGVFRMGVPRAIGGSGKDPDHDVFIKVTNVKQQNEKFDWCHGSCLDQFIPGAKESMVSAMASNPAAVIRQFFPDAADHVHLDDGGY
jgi:hypothetical protein